MKKNKIAVLLPFKDHFINSNAGSASIWVKDFNKNSVYKNNITIFGNTPFLDDLIDKKRYKNLTLGNINISGKNTAYVKQFNKFNYINKFDLIEIHNRPSYAKQIIAKYDLAKKIAVS